MAYAQLTAQKRDPNDGDVRADRNIPGIVYGPGLSDGNISVSIDYEEFRKTFRASGESTIIDMQIDGRDIPVLVHTIDWHPVTNEVDHVDFYAVEMGKELHTHILLEFVGKAPVVKEKNGVIVFTKESLEVKCLPRNLVHHIEVDISGLEDFHDHISIQQLIDRGAIPNGIEVLDALETNVVIATPPKKEIVEEVEEEAEGEETVEGEDGKESAGAEGEEE